jgi:hypothetical protein
MRPARCEHRSTASWRSSRPVIRAAARRRSSFERMVDGLDRGFGGRWVGPARRRPRSASGPVVMTVSMLTWRGPSPARYSTRHPSADHRTPSRSRSGSTPVPRGCGREPIRPDSTTAGAASLATWWHPRAGPLADGDDLGPGQRPRLPRQSAVRGCSTTFSSRTVVGVEQVGRAIGARRTANRGARAGRPRGHKRRMGDEFWLVDVSATRSGPDGRPSCPASVVPSGTARR